MDTGVCDMVITYAILYLNSCSYHRGQDVRGHMANGTADTLREGGDLSTVAAACGVIDIDKFLVASRVDKCTYNHIKLWKLN